MHMDVSGRPLYRKRFAAVKPFYNGQARVERLDGGREVINRTGGIRWRGLTLGVEEQIRDAVRRPRGLPGNVGDLHCR